MSEIVIIAALSKNGVIGLNGKMPWHIPEDLAHFKKLTAGHCVIMGRKTWESLPIKPLPNRENIVLSRDENLEIPNVKVFNSLEKAIKYSKIHEKIFLIGGAILYEQGLKIATKMEITQVNKEYEGDTIFPKINWDNWELVAEDNQGDYSFITYLKIE